MSKTLFGGTSFTHLSLLRLMALSKKLSSIDEHISCDPAYLTKVSFRMDLRSLFSELIGH